MRILRGLSSRLLPCGCVAGVYETYDGDVITLIDEHAATCPDADHRDGERISFLSTEASADPPGARLR